MKMAVGSTRFMSTRWSGVSQEHLPIYLGFFRHGAELILAGKALGVVELGLAQHDAISDTTQ